MAKSWVAALAIAGVLAGAAGTGAPAADRDDPAQALLSFLRAAGERDAERMWEQLSSATRARLGPTLAAFRRGAAPTLARSPGWLARTGGYAVILSEPLGGGHAVAAVARSRVPGRRHEAAYAAALRLEGGRWRIALRGPARLRAVLPGRAATVEISLPQIAFGVRARRPIAEASVWLDGLPFFAEVGSVSPRWITLWGRPGVPLEPGEHYVVGWARSGESAFALAWAFWVGPPPAR